MPLKIIDRDTLAILPILNISDFPLNTKESHAHPEHPDNIDEDNDHIPIDRKRVFCFHGATPLFRHSNILKDSSIAS